MGRFVKGEKVFILAKITEVNPEDSTRYQMQTGLAKFYATEAGDTIRSNPADVYTASELYAMFIDIGKMSSEDLEICFGEDINSVADVIMHGWTITEIRQMFVDWQYDNLISISDIVYYTPEGATTDPIICSVIDIIEGDEPDTATDNTYVLYNDEADQMYYAIRSEINSARKRSTGVTQALSDLKEATKKAREDIE